MLLPAYYRPRLAKSRLHNNAQLAACPPHFTDACSLPADLLRHSQIAQQPDPRAQQAMRDATAEVDVLFPEENKQEGKEGE
jgi:hypothetical protein